MKPRDMSEGNFMSPRRSVESPVRVADVVLMAGAAGCALALGYFAYFYYWTAERVFSSALAGRISIGSLLLFGLALVGVLRLSPSVRLNVATSLCSVGMSFVVLE